MKGHRALGDQTRHILPRDIVVCDIHKDVSTVHTPLWVTPIPTSICGAGTHHEYGHDKAEDESAMHWFRLSQVGWS